MTQQPIWKFKANLGDASPLEHGGLFLYTDETGVYAPELERLEPQLDGTFEIRRMALDALKEVRRDDQLYLVSRGYDISWPYPVATYCEWFADSLTAIADSMGMEEDELRADLLSDDQQRRAFGYQAVADHHGWDNFDAYPQTLARTDVVARYTKGELE